MDFSAFSDVFETLDITYVVLCNIITYVLIQTIESLKGKTIKKGAKRVVSAISAFFLAAFMWIIMEHSGEGLFYGFFIQFLTWDYMFKGWIDRLQKITSKTDEKSEE